VDLHLDTDQNLNKVPQVSICIPTYNNTYYLKKTLSSIISQTFTDYELIITDDSDNKKVKELIDQFNFQDKLRYYHNEKPLGSPRNWNCCISKAQGKYIKIMHHDDWFTSADSLKYFIEALESSGAAMAFSNAEVFYEKSNKSGLHSPGMANVLRLKANPDILFRGNFIGAPSMTMYKRDSELTFDKNLKWLVDVDFYIRYLKKHKSFVFIDKPLIKILTEAQNTVTATCVDNKNIEIFENFYVFDKLKATFSFTQTLANLNFLTKILRRFNVSNLLEVKQTGYEKNLPLPFHILFSVNKLSYSLVNILKRIRRLY
jgi:glycosyltransferase involved in cell wall biosynthesis